MNELSLYKTTILRQTHFTGSPVKPGMTLAGGRPRRFNVEFLRMFDKKTGILTIGRQKMNETILNRLTNYGFNRLRGKRRENMFK
jgi:hypothetical protein